MLISVSKEGVSDEDVSNVGVDSPPADSVIGKGAMTNAILTYDFFRASPIGESWFCPQVTR